MVNLKIFFVTYLHYIFNFKKITKYILYIIYICKFVKRKN